MYRNFQRCALTIAIAVSSSVCISHAQGLGGLLNKAKDKANGAGVPISAPASAQGIGRGTGLDSTGHPKHIQPESMSTPARERALADAIMHDPKPGTNEDHDGEAYLKMKQEYGFAPAYTADDSFFTSVPNFQGRANYYIDWIDKVSSEFHGSCTSTYGDQLQSGSKKIKTIHFATRAEKVNPDDELEGWKFAWDKSTGTLTIFFGDTLRTWSYTHPLSKWVAKNIG